MPDIDTQPDVFAEDDTDAGYLAPNNSANAVATAATPEPSPFRMLMVSAIEPSPLNPRRHFDTAAHEDLVASIKQYGVLQPILVRPQQDEHFGEFYQIVMGERRWRAAKEANLVYIPATIRENVSDADLIEMAMLENVQRQDLTPIEEGNGYARMLEFHPDLTQEKMAERLGISQGTVSNALRLLRLPEAVRQLVDNREISKQHGIALAGISDNPTKCVELALSAFREHWAVSKLDSEIKAFRSAEAERNQPRLDVQDVQTAGEGEKSDATDTASATPVATDNPAPAASPAENAGRQGAPDGDAVASKSGSDRSAPDPVIPAPSPTAQAPAAPPRLTTESIGIQTGADAGHDAEAPNMSANRPASVQDAAAVIPPPTPAPAPTPRQTAPVPADSGKRIATTIRQEDDDWLFEVDLTLDGAMAELRALWHISLTPLARKCVKALTDQFNAENSGDEPISPTEYMERILKGRATAAGIDLDTLQEIPE